MDVKAGLKLSPPVKEVTVVDRPVDGIRFIQYRAKIGGTVRCLGTVLYFSIVNCGVTQLLVGLRNLSPTLFGGKCVKQMLVLYHFVLFCSIFLESFHVILELFVPKITLYCFDANCRIMSRANTLDKWRIL